MPRVKQKLALVTADEDAATTPRSQAVRAPWNQIAATMNRMNELLMRALLNALAFLELSGDDEVDPDSALKVLEYAGYLLDQLDQVDKEALLAFVEREATTEPPGPHRDFLLAFPDAFGLK